MFEKYYDITKITDALKMNGMEQRFQDEMTVKVMALVDNRLLERTQDEMTDEQIAEFNKIEVKEEAEAYLESVLPMREIFDEEFDDVLRIVAAAI